MNRFHRKACRNCLGSLVFLSIFLAEFSFSQDEPTAYASRLGYEEADSLERSDSEIFELSSLYPYSNPYPLSTTHRFGDDVRDFDINLTAPVFVASNREFALFTTVVYNRRDTDAESFSVGVGGRWMLDAIDSVAGFRIHADMMDSAFGNEIMQLGLGADLFTSRGLDIIGNFYLPESDRKLAREFRQDERFVRSEIINNSRTTFNAPYAQGHAILQEQIDITDIKRKTTTTDISRLMQQFEQGRRGGDLRAVIDLPFFKRREVLRGMIGAYHYEGEFNGDMTGLMAGLTATPIKGFNVGVEYYDDEAVFGSNWVGTVGVSMPLDFETLLSPQDWGREIADALAGGGDDPISTSDYLTSKLVGGYAPRNNRVLTDVSAPIEDPSRRIVKRTVRTTTVASGTRSTIKTILDGIIFVNNGGAVGNGIQAGVLGGAGTAENPTNSINEGANLVQTTLGGTGTVYVQAANPYNEEVVVDASGTDVANGVTPVPRVTPIPATDITFTSSFKPIIACGPHVFGGDTARAMVTGGFYVNGIERARIQAFDVTGGLSFDPAGSVVASVGIAGDNVNNFIVDCNIVSTPNNGIVSIADGAATQNLVQIFDNRVQGTSDTNSDNNDTGILVRTIGTAVTNQVQIFDNTVADTSRHGISVRTEGNGGTINGGFINNNTVSGSGIAATDTGDAIRVVSTGNGGNLTLSTVNGNTINGTDNGEGIELITQQRGMIDVGQVNSNIIDGTEDDGIQVTGTTNNGGAGSTLMVGSINGNRLTNIDVPGGDHAISVLLSNSNMNGAGGSAVNVTSVNGNFIENVGGRGIQIRAENARNEATLRNVGTLTVASVDGNTILNTNNEGIRIIGDSGTFGGAMTDRVGTGTVTVNSVSNNIIEDQAGAPITVVGGDGIEILGREDFNLVVGNVQGNQINLNGNGSRGIDINLFDGQAGAPVYNSTIQVGLIDNNTIQNTPDRGINVELQDNTGVAANTLQVAGITNNDISNTGGEGIRVVTDDAGVGEIVFGAAGISNNMINQSFNDGIGILSRDAKNITIPALDGNIITTTTNEGIDFDSNNASTITVNSFSGNSFTLIGSGTAGIRADVANNAGSIITISGFDGNTIDGAAYATAIELDQNGAGTLTVNNGGGATNTVVTPGTTAGATLVDEQGTVTGTGISVNGGAPSTNDQ